MVEDRFLLAKGKVMSANTHVDHEEVKKPLEPIVEEEELFEDFLSVVKNY